jgi:hypothetical protein
VSEGCGTLRLNGLDKVNYLERINKKAKTCSAWKKDPKRTKVTCDGKTDDTKYQTLKPSETLCSVIRPFSSMVSGIEIKVSSRQRFYFGFNIF